MRDEELDAKRQRCADLQDAVYAGIPDAIAMREILEAEIDAEIVLRIHGPGWPDQDEMKIEAALTAPLVYLMRKTVDEPPKVS